MKKPTEKISITIGTLSGLVMMVRKFVVGHRPAAEAAGVSVQDRPGDERLGEEPAEQQSKATKATTDSTK